MQINSNINRNAQPNFGMAIKMDIQGKVQYNNTKNLDKMA